MSVSDDYPAIAVLHEACVRSGRRQPEAVRAFIEIERLRRISELLAAGLLVRGVESKDCDALDEWLREFA